ncbi:glycosyltransferase family 4 protein [Promineifilum sp.]|uniref:glycosyltransferase family 4 protein n=1 Tax=Promineifilum sp. TaxID=2664178 RepID=UPI0035B18016
MKILMVNSFNYVRGGAERCFLDLSALLEANGHEVVPFAMQHPQNAPSAYDDYFVSHMDFPTELAKPGLRPKIDVTERILYSREARRKIERIVADTRPDLVHIHGFIHEMSTSILPALKRASLPVVQTLHDYKIVCPNTTFISQESVCERCRGHRYYNIALHRCKRDSRMASILAGAEMYFHELFRLYGPNIDLFISPSDFLAHKVREHGVRQRIVTIPNFINPDRFQPHYEPENYFIFVGRLVQTKGILTLLEAVRRLGPAAELRVAGAGELEPELRAFVATHGLSNVKFLGHLGAEELTRTMQRAAFTVQPSEWYENYSMTVIESLACGTPVIGAAIGGIPEQVRDGWNGLLFEPGDAGQLAEKIDHLLNRRDLAVQMGRNGREQVERLNGPAAHYDQTMTVYEQLVGRTAVSPRPAAQIAR